LQYQIYPVFDAAENQGFDNLVCSMSDIVALRRAINLHDVIGDA